MELTARVVREYAREYAETEPLYAVEQDHVEMLPSTFASSEYGRRDVQWVVEWFFRRYLGSYPDKRRREIEAQFRENDFGQIQETLAAVTEQEEQTAENLRLLTALDGVDVPVGSAFLQFTFPDRYVTVDSRVWELLRESGELEKNYPDPPSIDTYLTFHERCRTLGERFDVDAWTLYRGLWRGWKDHYGE